MTTATDNDLAAARGALADREAAVAASSFEVDLGREKFALGEMSRGDLQRLSRRHQQQVEQREMARARVRAFERRQAEVDAAAATAKRAEARAEAAVNREERAQLLAALTVCAHDSGGQVGRWLGCR
jgi:hypothetical protein